MCLLDVAPGADLLPIGSLPALAFICIYILLLHPAQKHTMDQHGQQDACHVVVCACLDCSFRQLLMVLLMPGCLKNRIISYIRFDLQVASSFN